MNCEIESNDNNISIDDIENLLDDDMVLNKKEKWNKLDKTQKYKKLMIFADEYDDISLDLKDNLKKVFVNGLEVNKFSKISDVNYDSNTGKILTIPSLVLIDDEFILKQSKRASTSKSLPKKGLKTKRNKDNI